MFPIVRLAKEFVKFRKAVPLKPGEIHVSEHRCWPWDMDVFMELNNGRALTLYDLGRFVLFRRSGFFSVLQTNKWSMTMAGSTVRYRRRVRAFHKFQMHSGLLGFDNRFIYLHQTMYRHDEALSSVVYRVAVTDSKGIVPAPNAIESLGFQNWNPQMPDWVQNWISAENSREWPPVY